MEKKLWYQSKTVWVNLISAAAIVIQSQTGFVVDAEDQAAFLAVINLLLRAVTNSGISLKK